MERRTFIGGLTLGLLAAPLAADAQPSGKVARVGMLSAAQPRSASFMQAFEHRLRDLGYVEGQNLIVEFRTGEGKVERYSALAAELVQRQVDVVNPKLRGWVTYFRIGHASRCFAFVRQWVEKKVRRHLMRARNRRGFGWTRWSTAWLYDTLGLFGDYRVHYLSRA